MEIKRDAYLEQLKIRKDNGMIKIITGIRRCGKSFLLFVLFKKYLLESGVDNDHIIEIALDGIENEELRDPKKCYQHIKDAMKDDQKYYLLLDEVQFMSRFEEVLNSLLRISNIDVYVTGSNSKFLSSDIVTEFRGRGDEIRIYPLSFAEFYAAFDGDYDDAWEEYMIYGGLPQVLQFSVERQKAEYLKNIFTNVYIKDVVERNKLRNVDEIDTLVDILASAIGAPTNPTKISNTFKSERGINYSNKTISNHIDYLVEAFLISKADRYDIKGRKYVGANLKYYFSDVGLRNARISTKVSISSTFRSLFRSTTYVQFSGVSTFTFKPRSVIFLFISLISSYPIINPFIMVEKIGNGRIYDSRLSNGPIESINRKIKDLKRLGRGFRNFEHFRNRFLYATRSAPILNGMTDYNPVLYLENDDF